MLLSPGYFPIKLQALREGSVVHARVPVYQITASGKYAPLCTYLETVLTMVWYALQPTNASELLGYSTNQCQVIL